MNSFILEINDLLTQVNLRGDVNFTSKKLLLIKNDAVSF
jgi:hypothetical protein